MKRAWLDHLLTFACVCVALGAAQPAGAVFTFETIDQNQAGDSNRIALDSTGRVHVVYRFGYPTAPPRIELRYAIREAGIWTIEVLGFQQSSGYYNFSNPRLAVDSNDRVHVVYHSVNESGQRTGVIYGYRDQGGWHWETADPSSEALGDLSIAVDGIGDVHVAYEGLGASSVDLRYARRTNGVWSHEIVDPEGGGYCFLDLGPGGWPAISYVVYAPIRMKYASHESGTWVPEIVSDNPNLAGCSSLTVDGEGHPHLSFTTTQASTLTYAVRSNGQWILEIVPPAVGYLGYETSLALDQGGEPHIVYQDGGAEDLYYAVRTNGTWYSFLVSAAGNAGYQHDLALDDSDVAHVTFQTSAPGNQPDLFYAVGQVTAGAPVFPDASANDLKVFVQPNPTRAEATFRFELPLASPVQASIFDASGRWIRDLAAPAIRASGPHELTWDGRDRVGREVMPGVYFIRLDTDLGSASRSVVRTQ